MRVKEVLWPALELGEEEGESVPMGAEEEKFITALLHVVPGVYIY